MRPRPSREIGCQIETPMAKGDLCLDDVHRRRRKRRAKANVTSKRGQRPDAAGASQRFEGFPEHGLDQFIAGESRHERKRSRPLLVFEAKLDRLVNLRMGFW
jgi:hypothetical protein